MLVYNGITSNAEPVGGGGGGGMNVRDRICKLMLGLHGIELRCITFHRDTLNGT